MAIVGLKCMWGPLQVGGVVVEDQYGTPSMQDLGLQLVVV